MFWLLPFLFFFFFWLCLWGGQSLIRPPNLKSNPIKSLAPPWLNGTPSHPDYCFHLASSTSSGITSIRPAFSFWHLSSMCWQKAVCLPAHTQARAHTGTHTQRRTRPPSLCYSLKWTQEHPLASMKAQNLFWMAEREEKKVDREMVCGDLTMCTQHK